MSEYSPILDIVRPYLNLKFNEIPEDIRERINEALLFSEWDDVTPWQREQLIDQYDCQHDPMRAKKVDEACRLYLKIKYLEDEKNRLELMPARTPLDRESKIRQLNELDKELEALKSNQPQSNCTHKKITISLQQKTAILNKLREKGHDPQNLPKPLQGKAGIKKEVSDSLVNTQLFVSKKVFLDRWQELLNDSKIKYRS